MHFERMADVEMRDGLSEAFVARERFERIRSGAGLLAADDFPLVI